MNMKTAERRKHDTVRIFLPVKRASRATQLMQGKIMEFVSKVDMILLYFMNLYHYFRFECSKRNTYYLLSATCEDTTKGAKDKLKLTCNQYEYLDICGRSDKLKDEDFEAKKMCCACGGGSVPKKGT